MEPRWSATARDVKDKRIKTTWIMSLKEDIRLNSTTDRYTNASPSRKRWTPQMRNGTSWNFTVWDQESKIQRRNWFDKRPIMKDPLMLHPSWIYATWSMRTLQKAPSQAPGKSCVLGGASSKMTTDTNIAFMMLLEDGWQCRLALSRRQTAWLRWRSPWAVLSSWRRWLPMASCFSAPSKCMTALTKSLSSVHNFKEAVATGDLLFHCWREWFRAFRYELWGKAHMTSQLRLVFWCRRLVSAARKSAHSPVVNQRGGPVNITPIPQSRERAKEHHHPPALNIWLQVYVARKRSVHEVRRRLGGSGVEKCGGGGRGTRWERLGGRGVLVDGLRCLYNSNFFLVPHFTHNQPDVLLSWRISLRRPSSFQSVHSKTHC